VDYILKSLIYLYANSLNRENPRKGGEPMRPRNLGTLVALIVTLGFLVCMITPAVAGDVLIDSKILSVSSGIDKNGNSYIRFIVNETRKLKGVEYTAGVAVMAFQDHIGQLKELSDGDTLKAICAEREWQGRKSYTILAVVKK